MRSEFLQQNARGALLPLAELRQIMQDIQVTDYELHASFRILANGELDSEHIAAFMDASIRRDRMMARVFSHVAEMRKQRAYAAIKAHTNGNGKP
jgi:hypothetical protein